MDPESVEKNSKCEMPTSTDESGLSEETVDAFIREEGFWEQGMDREQKMQLYK